jgi:hypothetical protein
MKVTTVCGKEVSIYDKPRKNGTRQLLRTRIFGNHGQALEWARQFDDNQKTKEQLNAA